MNELVNAALECAPVPEMEQKSELGSDERIEMDHNNASSPSPPERRPASSGAPSPQRSHDDNNCHEEEEEDGDTYDTRETRTPPQASDERREYQVEQRYRSSPPPPPSLSSTAASYHHYQHHPHPHQQYNQHPQYQEFPQHRLRHPGESSVSGYYGAPPPPTSTNSSNSNRNHLRGLPLPARSPPPHPREVLPSATDSFKSGGCTCKKSRCLKLYCQCFSSSTTCGPKCKCVACHNSTLHADSIETARRTILERNPAAFDDKFQKPGAKDHYAVYGADIFSTATSTAAASSRDGSSMRQHQQHLQHHMPYTFAQQQQQQQQQQLSPPPPPQLLSTTPTSTPRARYSYTPPAYASSSSHAGPPGPGHLGLPLSFCLPPVPVSSPGPPITPTAKRINKFGCKCKRSFCLKKYCECYQNSTLCGLYCKCTNCKNFPDPNAHSGGASGAGTLLVSGSSATVGVPMVTPEMSLIHTPPPPGISNHPRNHMEASAAMAIRRTSPVPTKSTTPAKLLVSRTTSTGETHRHVYARQTDQDKDEDRLAMMAAVAMAELSGSLSHSGEQTESYSSLTTTPAPRRISNERELTNREHASGVKGKRKAVDESESTLSSVPLKKRKPVEHLTEDEEVRAVSSTSPMSVTESRNPSPVSTIRSPHYYPPQVPDHRYPLYHHTMPQHPQTGRYPPHGHEYGQDYHRTSPVHHHRDPRASPPPPYEYNRALPARYLQPSAPPSFRNSPPPYVRSSPPPYVRSSPPPHSLRMYKHNGGVTPSPYQESQNGGSGGGGGYLEETVRSSGLPKSLSFRKICSKCGKTRGEHGELGFGNKCVYQECGKCGAGQHMHERAGQPMGVLCCLTVEDGATPTASAVYERKIRELAARADLQRELQRRKEEATQDIVQRTKQGVVGADVQ